MSSLAEIMEPMHQLLRGRLSPEELAARFGAPASRARIYQQSARAHVDDVLARNYATLKAALGSATWRRVADGFFAGHPPRDFELNACVQQLPAHLEALVAAGEPGIAAVHCEIAHLEWLELAVYVSRAALPEPLAAPTVNPTLEVLQTRHQAATFVEAWRRWERGEAESAPDLPAAPAAQTVLVFRDPASESYAFQVADAELLLALKVVHDGLAPAVAAAEAGVSEEAVRRAVARAADLGIVVVPTEEGGTS